MIRKRVTAGDQIPVQESRSDLHRVASDQELSSWALLGQPEPPGLVASFLQAASMQSVILAGKGMWAAVHVLLKLLLLQCNLGLSSSFVVKK